MQTLSTTQNLQAGVGEGSNNNHIGGVVLHPLTIYPIVSPESDTCPRMARRGGRPKSKKSVKETVYLVDYMRTLIEQFKAANRYGTAANYTKVMHSIVRFSGGSRVRMTTISEQWVTKYNIFLTKRGLVRNSISFYMRILRAVYNRAVRQHWADPINPFNEVYTGIDSTRKRAIDERLISEINQRKLPAGSSLALARDLFIFSYCTRGMAFVDMAYLRKGNLQNGVLCYTRRKTGQLLSIRVETNIKRILDRYASSDSPYLFPLLSSTEPSEAYKEYRKALNHYNRQLERLAVLIPRIGKLTSYTARHSWATAARNHNIPISVISAGLGHTSEQTTRIYLALMENSVIDEANHEIIGHLR